MKSTDDKSPLISCVCVTNNRVPFLRRSINCFLNQTYENKELIIVYESADTNTKEYLENIDINNIISIEIEEKGLSLGEKRNISIDRSNGVYFCQWDDDDWFHNQRLHFQFHEAMENGKEASVLVYKLMYNSIVGLAYLSQIGPWPNTILCKKSLINKEVSYLPINKGEDRAFVDELYRRNYIYPIINPQLYIYVYHGNNTWDSSHFRSFFANGQPLSWKNSEIVKAILKESLLDPEASRILMQYDFKKELNYFYKSLLSDKK